MRGEAFQPKRLSGNFTGCAYGDGTAEPFRSPNDCPICNASGFEVDPDGKSTGN